MYMTEGATRLPSSSALMFATPAGGGGNLRLSRGSFSMDRASGVFVVDLILRLARWALADYRHRSRLVAFEETNSRPIVAAGIAAVGLSLLVGRQTPGNGLGQRLIALGIRQVDRGFRGLLVLAAGG